MYCIVFQNSFTVYTITLNCTCAIADLADVVTLITTVFMLFVRLHILG